MADGRWFVSFPPFPALLMLPFVWLHGVRFNDVFFTVCLAAANVGLFVALLRALRDKGLLARTEREWLLLAATWAFGSVYFPTAIRGEVWFTAHVVGVTCTLVFLLAAMELRAPVVAGLAFGFGAVTRTPLAFAFPFVLAEALRGHEGFTTPAEWGRVLWSRRGALLRFTFPSLVVIAIALWLNHERFGQWLEFGHGLLFNNRVNANVRAYGLFHPHFFPDNFRSAFLRLPTLTERPFGIGFDGNGMSMALTTPPLVFLLFSRHSTAIARSFAAALALVALPGLFYMNNGWFQFGYRFANDFLPYLLVLLALSSARFDRRFVAAAALGVVVCTWGALVFNRF